MTPLVVEIESHNEHSIFSTLFIPKKSNSRSIVISSATGVLQNYYSKFATYFCSLGFTVYTFDYSGIGLSHSKTIKNNTSNLYDWANNQAHVLQYVNKQNPKHKIILITHSIGGQLIAFNHNIELVDSIITVASQSGYWNMFNGFNKLKMYLFWNLIIPATIPFFGYFPAKKLKLFENLPKQVTYQWRQWGNKKNYFLHYAKKEDLVLDKINCSMLILSFPKDEFAPKRTVDWLANIFKNAKVDRRHILPEEIDSPNIGHFGFFRERFESSLWQLTHDWINIHLDSKNT
ncbi:alpha/beta fold hydrolase [uncultured Lacinutrix sp.]|uniref:alpha/beta hydrolase family protein n=1 Tax=uncultured Lacinutrix sp. TaxID=574032 RepID=UPI0026377B65|nr:alpha/beta fold hydrolase [uncultured Lacinutrix sp.]